MLWIFDGWHVVPVALVAFWTGGFIVEEVTSFKRYVPEFCKTLADCGYCVHAMQVNSSLWLQWPRPRTDQRCVPVALSGS